MNCPRYEKVIEDRDCLLRYIGAKRKGGPVCPGCIRGQLLYSQKQEKAEQKKSYTPPEDFLARAIDNLEDGRGLEYIPTDSLAKEYNRLAMPDGHTKKNGPGMTTWLRRLGLSVSLWSHGGEGITTQLFINNKAHAFITKRLAA